MTIAQEPIPMHRDHAPLNDPRVVPDLPKTGADTEVGHHAGHRQATRHASTSTSRSASFQLKTMTDQLAAQRGPTKDVR